MGQNYLSDPNYIARIATTFVERVRASGQPGAEPAVVELGPGLGAITRQLLGTFPGMLAVELDGRAVELLRQEVPGLDVLHEDMLKVDYGALAAERGQRLNVIGNLPYNIVSDVLLSLAMHPGALRFAFLMVQKEVADKITAKPGSREYGWLAVLMQIYARPSTSFKLPPTVFYPRPKVVSAMVDFDFLDISDLPRVDAAQLCEVVRTAFRQRKQAFRYSLKPILARQRGDLPRRLAGLKASQATPQDFVEATRSLFPIRVDANAVQSLT